MDEKELLNRFTYHVPYDEKQLVQYKNIREYGMNFSRYVVENCPQSRELSLAITKIEEAVMWANASIARNDIEGTISNVQ